MKASKGCVNRNCISFTKKTKYKDSFEHCPQCGEKLEYVCSDCWKVLEHSTTKYCEACKTKHEQKREQNMDKIKKVGATVATATGVAWKNKKKIAEGAEKVIEIVKKL